MIIGAAAIELGLLAMKQDTNWRTTYTNGHWITNRSLTSGTCSTAGLGAKLWTVGARWRFDRQTFVYAIGATLRNGVSASYNNNSSSALLPGSDTKNFALGVSYSF